MHKGQIAAIAGTSKAATNIEIWQDGAAQALRVQRGDSMPVGAVLATA